MPKSHPLERAPFDSAFHGMLTVESLGGPVIQTVLVLCVVLFSLCFPVNAEVVFKQSTIPVTYPCVPPSGFGICNRTMNLNVGEYLPSTQTIVGDIFYLHGFADTFSNHRALFHEWTDAGFRVLAFDYPGHGGTRTLNPKININDFNFEGLMTLANQVERIKRQDANRPLLLAGWSTGGLLAVRMIQKGNLAKLSRRPQGMILFAPGISVNAVVGRQSFRYPLGEVTFETLTHNEDTRGLAAPFPRSPGDAPLFASNLFYHSLASQGNAYPAQIPTLVFVAGDSTDKYVPSSKVTRWVKGLPGQAVGVQCPNARHWLDNELPEYGGEEVRAAAKVFAEKILTKDFIKYDYSGKVCRQFR